MNSSVFEKIYSLLDSLEADKDNLNDFTMTIDVKSWLYRGLGIGYKIVL